MNIQLSVNDVRRSRRSG